VLSGNGIRGTEANFLEPDFLGAWQSGAILRVSDDPTGAVVG